MLFITHNGDYRLIASEDNTDVVDVVAFKRLPFPPIVAFIFD